MQVKLAEGVLRACGRVVGNVVRPKAGHLIWGELAAQGDEDRCRLSLPHWAGGLLVGKGVVTGGRSGIQASRGEGFGKNFRSAAFVTPC